MRVRKTDNTTLKTKTGQATDIFNYVDYRLFLKDLITELKTKHQYKVKTFADRAGIKTPGYMRMIIDGKRNLTTKVAHKFCLALNIVGREKNYFEKLVLYNQAHDPDLKKEYFNDLLSLKPRSEQYATNKLQSRYFSRPYYACIQEMVSLKDFCEDPEWIATRCQPPLKVSQVKEALETLVELGLLNRNPQGKLQQTQKLIQTDGQNTQINETYHYHEALIDRARRALGEVDQEQRNYFALTLPVTPQLFSKIVQEAYEFRDRIIRMVQEDFKDSEEVYQMNFQLFPMTKKKDPEKL